MVESFIVKERRMQIVGTLAAKRRVPVQPVTWEDLQESAAERVRIGLRMDVMELRVGTATSVSQMTQGSQTCMALAVVACA